MAKKLHKKKTHSLRSKKSRVKKTKRPTTQKQFLKSIPYGFAPPAWMAHPDTNNTITKERFVHQWVFNGWTITSAQAWRSLGITRLADVIWKMRRRGVKIRTIMTQGKDRFNKTVHFATYKYVSGKRKFTKSYKTR